MRLNIPGSALTETHTIKIHLFSFSARYITVYTSFHLYLVTLQPFLLQTDGREDNQKDGHTEGQTDEQTDRPIPVYTTKAFVLRGYNYKETSYKTTLK